MGDHGLPVVELQDLESKRISMSVEVRPESAWFSGHFPQFRVLPGVAMLVLVNDSVRRWAAQRRRQVQLARIQRVRFNQLVRPGAHLEVVVEPVESDREIRIDFRVRDGASGVARGTLLYTSIPDNAVKG